MSALTQLFAALAAKSGTRPHPDEPRGTDMSIPWQLVPFERPRGPVGSVPYREPMQAGPAPPVTSPLAAVFERKR